MTEMKKPAYKESTFICVKCGKKYTFTLTTNSEIVLIEEVKK